MFFVIHFKKEINDYLHVFAYFLIPHSYLLFSLFFVIVLFIFHDNTCIKEDRKARRKR